MKVQESGQESNALQMETKKKQQQAAAAARKVANSSNGNGYL